MNNYFDKNGNYINCENLSLAEIYHRAFALGVESVAIEVKRPQGDLISRESLKKAIFELPNDNPSYYYTGDLLDRERVLDEIDNAPTVVNENLIAERPQGEWIVTAEDNDGVHRICCPFCSYEKGSNNTDHIVVTFTNFPRFCENCGATMRGEKNGETT